MAKLLCISYKTKVREILHYKLRCSHKNEENLVVLWFIMIFDPKNALILQNKMRSKAEACLWLILCGNRFSCKCYDLRVLAKDQKINPLVIDPDHLRGSPSRQKNVFCLLSFLD